MFLPEIPELSLYGVMERGVPNAERVVIRANQDIDMANYGLLLGFDAGQKTTRPINNRFFWFGAGQIKAGDWIHVYTGDGSPEKTTLKSSSQPVYTIYWGFSNVVLSDKIVVPILFRMDCITINKIISPQLP